MLVITCPQRALNRCLLLQNKITFYTIEKCIFLKNISDRNKRNVSIITAICKNKPIAIHCTYFAFPTELYFAPRETWGE